MRVVTLVLASLCAAGCGSGGGTMNGGDGGGPPPTGAPACSAAMGGGQASTMMPTMTVALSDRYHEGWLASPAVADLDRDGTAEIIIARAERLLVFRPDGTIKWSANITGRIWSSPLVLDLTGDANLEVVFAARDRVHAYNAMGQSISGFPVQWRDEIRSLAAGDTDGDGRPELVAVTTSPLSANMQRDIIQVFRADGSVQRGFPPNTTGTSGCDNACYVTGGYDQNIAVGPIDDDNAWDLFAGQDNAYLSWHRGNGEAFPAASIFRRRTRVLGVRFMHDYAEAQQGYADNEDTGLQAHFTNSAPAIADLDGDGTRELIVLGSVQNASQNDRLKGVGLWVINRDGTRPAGWTSPFHVPAYLAGLWDFEGTNIVGATNQVSVADVLNDAGFEMVFAGFDGRIHLVNAQRMERWNYQYTTANNVLTGGVAIADLSGDGRPEIVFASYSTEPNRSHLFVLDSSGREQAKIALPGRGSMAVPTVADVDGNGTLEIVVNLKDGMDRMPLALVFTVPGSSNNCVLWSTGRGNLLRNGYVPRR